tara:strand:- start:165 stop:542 length:378 start_codon:yes stop_codon:yes gene_type:complete
MDTDVREFDKQGEDFHNQITELYKKDRILQQDSRLEFTQEPEDFRERMMDIEATAQGLRKVDEGYLDTGTQKIATGLQMEKLVKATDDAMLRLNPKMAEENLQYKDGFFIPLNFKELKEKIEGGL